MSAIINLSFLWLPSLLVYSIRLTILAFLSDDSFRTRNASSASTSFSPISPLPSTSRGAGSSADPKNSGSKDSQPRKATL